jgi:bifunctional non-homologous end joining protein LigD
MPIDWDELTPRLRPDQFTLRNAAQRLRRLRHDPWREYWKLRQRLTARALRAVAADG